MPSTRNASQVFSTSFIRLPAPATPSHSVRLPIALKTGASNALACSGPDASICSWPASAGPRVPDTGASTNSTSGRLLLAVAASSSVARGPMVPICTHAAPGRSAASTPLPSVTAETVPASGSIVMTTSAPAAAAAGCRCAEAPSSVSGVVRPGVRFQTSTCRPALSRLRVIAAPIVPVPSTATRGSAIRVASAAGSALVMVMSGASSDAVGAGSGRLLTGSHDVVDSAQHPRIELKVCSGDSGIDVRGLPGADDPDLDRRVRQGPGRGELVHRRAQLIVRQLVQLGDRPQVALEHCASEHLAAAPPVVRRERRLGGQLAG